MSSEIRRKDSSVTELLRHSPELVSFFQTVRILERAAVYHNRDLPKGLENAPEIPLNTRSVGNFTPPTTEVLRFSGFLSLSFPGRETIKIEQESLDQAARWHMMISFMGLTGATGVLPFHYTEILFERLKLRDQSLKDFLDIFNHRIVSLFFKAGVKYRLPISYERNQLLPSGRKTLDDHTHTILSLLGLGTDHLLDQLNIHHETLVFFSGLLSQRVRTTHGLKQMLNYYFQVPIKIEEFIGEWHELIDDVRSRLPYPGNPLGQNSCLGKSAILGNKGWFAQGKLRIVLGPLNAAQFRQFSPGTSSLKELNELVKFYSGTELSTEYVLQVARKYLPNRIQLKQNSPPTIGWDTWLASQEEADIDNDVLEIKVSSARLN